MREKVMVQKANTKTGWQSFRDLHVWQRALELTTAVYRLTQLFPREEAFGLTAQMRRCAISIPSNLAEGHGRMSSREFKRFLLIARGSNCELQTQLEVTRALALGDPQLLSRVQNLSYEVEKMLVALLIKLKEKSG